MNCIAKYELLSQLIKKHIKLYQIILIEEHLKLRVTLQYNNLNQSQKKGHEHVLLNLSIEMGKGSYKEFAMEEKSMINFR